MPPTWTTTGGSSTTPTWVAGKWDRRWLGAGPVTCLGQIYDPVMFGNPTAELIAARMREWVTTWTATAFDGGLQRVLIPAEVAVSATGGTWAWT